MFFAGIDVGSRTTKCVILDQNGGIVSFHLRETGVRGQVAAEQAFLACLEKASIQDHDVRQTVSTGYGKRNVPLASDQATEISCHARGALHVLPDTRTVIDIGGQDSKVILLDEAGFVIDFAMNDRCAAGTGRFLEFMAAVLHMDLAEMASVRHDLARIRPVNSLCTVFAESEVISLLAEGCLVEDIVRGLHGAVAERTRTLMQQIAFVPPLTMTGGVARNSGVVQALQSRLRLPVRLPDQPQMIGALGAACVARSRGLETNGFSSQHRL